MSKSQDSEGLAGSITNTDRLIVDFTGAYCPPCKQLEPILAALAEEYRDRIDVLTIDIEEHPELAQQYGVRSVPTLIAFRDGVVRSQQVGFSKVHRVREMFSQLLG